MDAQATPQPQGPRNLTIDVAKWLRKMGFTAIEHVYPSLTTVEARWAAPDGRQFYVDYEYQSGPQPQATLHMAVYQAGVQHSETLVQRQHVRRLREVRQLVANDASYRAARIASLLTAYGLPVID